MQTLDLFSCFVFCFCFWRGREGGVTGMGERKGGRVHELTVPVDGFHPNLKVEALAVDALWRIHDWSKVLHVLGKVDPHNAMIRKMFEDQGDDDAYISERIALCLLARALNS